MPLRAILVQPINCRLGEIPTMMTNPRDAQFARRLAYHLQSGQVVGMDNVGLNFEQDSPQQRCAAWYRHQVNLSVKASGMQRTSSHDAFIRSRVSPSLPTITVTRWPASRNPTANRNAATSAPA